MSATSISTPQKGSSCTLHYEPPLYCSCGLKAPLCVARESGRAFYGCQKWKADGVSGCGFFEWKDIIEEGFGTDHQKRSEKIEERTDKVQQVLARHGEQLKHMMKVMHSEMEANKRFRKLNGCAWMLLFCIVAMVYFQLRKSDLYF
ncbi:unnamed protein product [Cuscuta europaea]|uniref:GRF-type domain-containing protein n=1 Tax=Cuscuta europaea TaxID=41803 RepID=A0A9P0YHX6_CUSEU|nr:unnamed protein product [Cuscuta europaea]